MKYKATLLKADTPTVNGRIYPWELLKNAVEEYTTSVPKEQWFGKVELGFDNDDYDISLQRISHKIEEIICDDENKQVDVIVSIIDSPTGQAVQEILKNFSLSVVPHAYGEVDDNGQVVTYELAHIDLTLSSATNEYAKLEECE